MTASFLLVSRTLLRILAELNNAVVGVVLILPLIPISSSLFCKLFATIPSAQIRIGITVTFKSHSFLISQARSEYLSIFQLLFISLWSTGTTKSTSCSVLLFLIWPFDRNFMCFILHGRFWFVNIPFGKYSQILISCMIPSGSPFPPKS